MDKADFYPGKCSCCLAETEVQLYEGIYWEGSEARLCKECGEAIRRLLGDRGCLKEGCVKQLLEDHNG